MTRSPRHRWMPIALVASLAANMFLGGFILSHLGPGGPPRPPKPENFLEDLAATLPSDDAARLHRVLDANRDALREEHALHEAFPDKVRAALLAEPFDADALLAVFTTQDQRERELRTRVIRAVVAATAAMSPEGRRRMAEFRPGPPPPPRRPAADGNGRTAAQE